MKKLIFRRLVAFCLDYVIIVVYALLLFLMTKILHLKEIPLHPISGQIVGFISLTLPVFLYFFLMERSKSRATIGKNVMNISICSQYENSEPEIFKRNILKFLPWEIAHTGVHWIVFYSQYENEAPLWVWFFLILPQIIVLIYLISIFVSKGESSIYDRIAKTKINVN